MIDPEQLEKLLTEAYEAGRKFGEEKVTRGETLYPYACRVTDAVRPIADKIIALIESTRASDREIADHRQALYASADGRPAANHAWLDQMLNQLIAERTKNKQIETKLREARDAIDAACFAYGFGGRPSSPPMWLTKLSIALDRIASGL